MENTGLQQRLPNVLTIARFGLTVVFFILLAMYRYPTTGRALPTWALGVFILAIATDALDGYFARRWSAQTVFGRVMDPLCDKILILGSLVMLAGPGFATVGSDPKDVLSVTGIEPWMVVVVLTRELLVTGLRTLVEGRGLAFGAGLSGKLKMILQSITIPVVLALVAFADPMVNEWARTMRDILVWAMVIVTAISAGPYVLRARRLLVSS